MREIKHGLTAKELTEASIRLQKIADDMRKSFSVFVSSNAWSEINKAGKQFEKYSKELY